MKLSETVKFHLARQELNEILNPEKNPKNIQLFGSDSKSQEKFSAALRERGIESSADIPESLKKKVEEIRQDISKLKHDNLEISQSTKNREKLDFDIAKIFHKNLDYPKAIVVNYDFWLWLTMECFIENVFWRWVGDPENINKLRDNSIIVYKRSYGERIRRIDCLRYWVIADRLFCQKEGYKYLDNLAKLYKIKNGPFQDFINNIIDNNLYSQNDIVVKNMARIMLNDHKVFNTNSLTNSFKRYHVFKNRLLIDGEYDILEKEICID